MYEFEYPQDNTSKIIKVFGVGGGGGNAVKYMYELGIHDVDFFVANTDIQALQSNPVPNKLQLGTSLTKGLGAGAKPEVGREAAMESKQQIQEILGNNTEMVFITAGMGGGTGTGAAPVIAEITRELDILTVGIVTMPFKWEGKPKEKRAIEGIEELKQHCDTVLIILNDKLQEVYGRSSMKEAFSQADNILTTAAKSIAEVITDPTYYINVDFQDVRTVMKDAGSAVMGSATVKGEDRAVKAAQNAISSPLLNNTNITNARYVLLSILVKDYDDFQMDELEQITEFVREQAGDDAEVIFGVGKNEDLDGEIAVTIIATGFDENAQLPKSDFLSQRFQDKDQEEDKSPFDKGESKRIEVSTAPKVSVDLEEKEEQAKVADSELEEEISENVNDVSTEEAPQEPETSITAQSTEAAIEDSTPQENKKNVFSLDDDYGDSGNDITSSKHQFKSTEDEEGGRLKVSNFKESAPSAKNMSSEELKKWKETPAYMRRGIKLKDIPPSDSES